MELREQDDLVLKVEKAKEQIARLRKQQTDLEREKSDLEDLKRQQEEWAAGKREYGDALRKTITVLEGEAAENGKMGVLIQNSRETLSEILDQILSVKEDRWTPATLKEELNRSLLIIHRARNELSAASGRIPALEAKGAGEGGGEGAGSLIHGMRLGGGSARELVRFGFWLGLPLAVMALILIIIAAII